MSDVQLDTIELCDYLTLPNIKNLARRAGSVRFTIDGGYVSQSVTIAAGQQLIVEAYEDGGRIFGWYTGDQVDAINALYESGAHVVFTHHLGSWTVKVLERDFKPAVRYSNPDGETIYIGTMTLLLLS